MTYIILICPASTTLFRQERKKERREERRKEKRKIKKILSIILVRDSLLARVLLMRTERQWISSALLFLLLNRHMLTFLCMLSYLQITMIHLGGSLAFKSPDWRGSLFLHLWMLSSHFISIGSLEDARGTS